MCFFSTKCELHNTAGNTYRRLLQRISVYYSFSWAIMQIDNAFYDKIHQFYHNDLCLYGQRASKHVSWT